MVARSQALEVRAPGPERVQDAPMGHTSDTLAAHTSLGVGGPAVRFVFAATTAEVRDVVRAAAADALPLFVLGGGSNLLVADTGFPGVVLKLVGDRLEVRPEGTVLAEAGLPWERLVDAAVSANLAGVECLTGIPGTVGAAPIQNIGAYGQEVAETLVRVRAWDRLQDAEVTLDAAACGFAYRDSRFKRSPDRFIVLSVELRLEPGGAPCLRYDEVRRAVPDAAGSTPSLAEVQAAVRRLRRHKGMLLEPAPEGSALDTTNARSAGSFFTNPVVSATLAAGLPPGAPRHVQPDGRVKLAAAWLIEHSGIARGFALGAAAVSTQHTLALVNRGGATAQDLVRLAAWVRRAVRRRFGISLTPEPVFLGFSRAGSVTELLDAAEIALPESG